MKLTINSLLLLIFFICQYAPGVNAQCNSNTSICYQGLAGPFAFNQSTPGPPTDFANPTMCSTGLYGNPNGFGFIVLYITTSGPLNLLVDGNANTGFIDVVVYNIPNGVAPCTAVMNSANEIGCNYATSAVGCTQFGNDFGCTSSVPAPYVTAGQTVMIIVHDYSSASNTFTLNLGPNGAQTGPPNPAINPAGPFCVTGPNQQLTAVNQGGTWSGPGVSPSGVFSPSAAGIGTFTVTYNVGVAPCNSSSTTTITVTGATVTPPANTSICQGTSTTLTASGATSYTWSPATGLSSTTGATVTASPTTTTTYTVTGTTGGCTSSGTVTVTVTPPPTITVNSATICSGQSATLTASGSSNYTWSPATGLSATTGATVTAAPAATTTYTVTASNGGCNSSATSTVTVNPSPTITVNSPTICSGGSTTLTAAGAASYSWSPGTGLSSTTGASVTANPTVTTTYTVTGTSAAGCTGTATSTVTIGPNPTVTVNSASICSGAAAPLTASGANTYTWSPGTGLSSTTGASVTANPATTTTYTVTGTINGCTGTATSTVTVNPNPTVTVNSGTMCSGGSLTLTANGATSYTWSPATGLSATTGSTVTATPAATTTYTVTGTTAGCTATANATVTVNPAPTVTANPATICNGASATLNATGASTYSWSPATGLSATTGGTVTANPSATTTYTITGTSAAGCTGTGTVTVTVNPVPVVNVPPATICNGASATLTASGATTYTWSPAAGLSATTGTSVTANPASTTTYTVNGTSAGCTGTTTVTVTVNPVPSVTPVNNAVYCPGVAVPAATLASNPAGATMNWTNSNTATGLAASGTNTISAFTTANSGSTPIVSTVTITPVLNGCTGANSSFTITVNPTPVIAPVNNVAHCVGETFNAVTFSSTPAATINWTNSNTTIGLGASGTNSTPAFTGASNSTSDISGTITLNASLNGCNAQPVSFVMTVAPAPVMNPVPSVTVCSGLQVPASNLSGNSSQTVYEWTNSNPAIGVPANGTGNTPPFTATNNGSAPVTGNFQVTPWIGTCSGTPQNFSITVSPTPAVNPIADLTHCAGTTVAQLAPSSNVNGTTFTWSNDNTSIGLGASGTASTPQFTAANPGAASQTATVTVVPTANGCPGTPETFTITVHPIPVITQAQSVTQCHNTQVSAFNFNASPASNITWTNSNTSIGLGANGSASTPAFTCTNTTTVNQTGTITVNAAANGCSSAPMTFFIEVRPQPIVTLPQNATVCAGTFVPASNFQGSPQGATFNWTNSAPSIGNAASGTGNYATFLGTNTTQQPVTATITVTPTLSQCTGSPVSYTITVNPVPVATASNTGPYCLMDDAVFAAGNYPNATYSWSGPNGFTSAAQNPGITDVGNANAGTYTVTVTANGCSSQASTNLVITQGTPVSIAQAGPYCGDTPNQQLSVDFPGGTWSGPGIVDAATGMFSPQAAGAGDVTVTYTPPVGCMVANSAVITVHPVPVIGFAGDDLEGCANHEVLFTDNSVPANGDLLWDFGDGNTSSANGTVSHIYTSSGLYTVTLTSSTNGCSATQAITSYINVIEPAQAAFSVLPSAQAVTSDPNFHFSNNSSNATQYSWIFGDFYTSNEFEPSHTYPEEAGSYEVLLVANNDGNCPDTARMVVTVKEDLVFYVPNAFTPDGDQFNNVFQPVFHSGYDPQSYTLYIFDRWGTILFESHNANVGWDGTYRGNIVKEGVYTWKIDFKVSTSDKRVQYVGDVTLLK